MTKRKSITTAKQSPSLIPWNYTGPTIPEGGRANDIRSAKSHDVVCFLSSGDKALDKANGEFIVRAVNSHDAMVEALRFTDNGHGHFAGCVRDTPVNPSRPCRKSCEMVRAALALAGKTARERYIEEHTDFTRKTARRLFREGKL